MARVIHESIPVVLPVCLRGDDGDFVVEFAMFVDGEFSTCVVHGVPMELVSGQYHYQLKLWEINTGMANLRCIRLPCQFSQFLTEDLLVI